MKAKRRTAYRVNEVARMTGISVRTLHHYDEIGLLVPPARSNAGYRLYDDEALLRLQQILIGRELGLPLEQIRRTLDDPSFDRRRALLEQREQLRARAEQALRMIGGIDHALELLAGSAEGTSDEREETEDEMNRSAIFDGFDHAKVDDEAKARWGNTGEYAESARRTKSYTKADWERHRQEQSAIYGDAVRAMNAGKRPTDADVLDIAERHRQSIDRWFYPCSHAMHRGLADLYEADARFAANIDKFGEGLTSFLSAAIRANAERGATGE